MERGRGIEPLALAWKAKVLPLYEPRINKFMFKDTTENFLVLYKLTYGHKPYQSTKSYTNSKTFIPDPILTNSKTFIPDPLFMQPKFVEGGYIGIYSSGKL